MQKRNAKTGCIIVGAIAAALLPCGARAQSSANMEVDAILIDRLVLSRDQDLFFGVFLPGTADATITLTAEGRTAATGAEALEEGVPAKFTVVGASGLSIVWDIPEEINLAKGGVTLVASTVGPGLVDAPSSLNAAGTAVATIGATTTLPSTARAGAFTGLFQVSVNYQ